MKKQVLTYTVDGAGWAILHLYDGNENHRFIVSYLHDSLKELSASVLQLKGKTTKCLVSFMDEPGELELEIVKSGETVHIRAKEYENTFGSVNGDAFRILFSFEVLFVHFAKAVFLAMYKIDIEMGQDGYLNKWGMHPFPAENYSLLKTVYAEKIRYWIASENGE